MIHWLNKPAKLENQISPEIELGNTCYTIVLPFYEKFTEEQKEVLVELEKKALYKSTRADTADRFWRLVFVIGSNEFPYELLNAVQESFGEFLYLEKVC